MSEQRRLPADTPNLPGPMHGWVRGRLLQDIVASDAPQTEPDFAAVQIWEPDPEADPLNDPDSSNVFTILSLVPGANPQITIASTNPADDERKFRKYVRVVIRGSTDFINDKKLEVRANSIESGGILTIPLNGSLEAVAALGEVVRLVPQPKKLGRVVLAAHRWEFGDLEAGTIVWCTQDEGGEYFNLEGADCPKDDSAASSSLESNACIGDCVYQAVDDGFGAPMWTYVSAASTCQFNCAPCVTTGLDGLLGAPVFIGQIATVPCQH